MTKVGDKKADLAGPGIGSYKTGKGPAQRLPSALLDAKESAAGHLRGQALTSKTVSCSELNLLMTTVTADC